MYIWIYKIMDLLFDIIIIFWTKNLEVRVYSYGNGINVGLELWYII